MRRQGVLYNFSRRAISSSSRVCGGSRRPETLLFKFAQNTVLDSCPENDHSNRRIPSSKRMSSTMLAALHGPAVVVHQHEVICNCCCIRGNSRSKNFTPIQMTGQSTIPNVVQIGSPINGDTSIDHHSLTAKSYIFQLESKNVSRVTFPLDEDVPFIKINRNAGHVREKNITPFVSRLYHMLCCPLYKGFTILCCKCNTYHWWANTQI